jgi:DNA replication protein DnaC
VPGRLVNATAVEALVDRLVHHAEVIILQGDSYRLKDRPKEVTPRKPR